MATPKVYVLCDTNCKWESMTKEQILSAIMQAVNEGTISNIDAGFITKIKEQNTGKNFKIWTGTSAEYLAIPTANIDENCLYIITDDTDLEDIKRRLNALEENIEQGGSGFLGAHADTVTIKDVGANNYLDLLVGDTVTGEVFATTEMGAYYDAENKKIFGRITNADHADKADEADHADKATTADNAVQLKNGDLTYKRSLLFQTTAKNSTYKITTTEKSRALTSYSGGLLIIEIEEYTNSATYDGAILAKYRTTPFMVVDHTYSTVNFNSRYYFTNGDKIKISFYVSGTTLYYKLESGENEYYIKAIYEEI